MKHPSTIALPLLVAALLGAAMFSAGCVAPGAGTRSVEFIDPPLSDYFTGNVPDFNNRMTHDPLGRKFRVVFLWTQMDSAKEAQLQRFEIESGAATIQGMYMGLREQASESRLRNIVAPKDYPPLAEVSRKAAKAIWRASIIDLFIANGRMPDPSARAFAERRFDIDSINTDLARKYPNLFSDDANAFPIEVALCGAFQPQGPIVVKTIWEAWLIGLPEHATLEHPRDPAAFPTKEAFLDPLDAIAASLFKLSSEQWEWLEPANPNDYEWLK